MTDLRKLAKGRECQVRLDGICNHNPETTVLAHYRMAGTCGTGIKPNDLQGAWACSSCHAAEHGAIKDLERYFIRLAFMEGVLRTQNILIKEGVIKW